MSSGRWFLLDGSLSLIYLAVFVSIAYLWRPTGNNQRLAMSEELAQDEDEADADDYELAARDGDEEGGLGGPLRPDHPDDDDDEPKKARQASAVGGVEDSRVVFALDDDDEEDEDDELRRKRGEDGGGYEVDEREEAGEGERLVGGTGSGSKKKDD